VEYVWFNNVETRPGQGYPRTYQDQERWQGGWTLNRRGRLTLKAGGRLKKLLSIFSNPVMPSIDDYYEPWTYDYEALTNAPAQQHTPVARPKSLLTGRDMKVTWSANWDDDLGGGPTLTQDDPVLKKLSEKIHAGLRADLHVLPAEDLRALPQPGLPPARPGRSTSGPRTASSW